LAVYDRLLTVIMIVALVVGVWCFTAAARDRWLGRGHLAGLAVVAAAMVAQAVVAAVRLAGGDRPEEYATFLGYLVTSALFLPLAVGLSFMERTRWGAVIAGGGCVVVAVLGLRLQQLWTLDG
jgi:hypothetical protein